MDFGEPQRAASTNKSQPGHTGDRIFFEVAKIMMVNLIRMKTQSKAKRRL
jgi:hypothetical protein